ncbi:hypothetical protein SLE2022_044380 [Rubroshorea leprosula]
MAVFSKVLTKIDVERRLSLTADDDEAVLPQSFREQPVLLQVKDENGSLWSFRRCTILIRPGIRPKLLIDDSRQFVRSRGLNCGDEINLFWEDDKASGRPDRQHKIEVTRKNRCPNH